MPFFHKRKGMLKIDQSVVVFSRRWLSLLTFLRVFNLVPMVSLLCLHCLFSRTMEAEKRDPGNEVGGCYVYRQR